jgi:hypothetical protein
MKRNPKSRNSLDGKIVKLRQGLAIYRVKASPFYRVRIWIPSQRKRVVRTTKADTRAEAIPVAEELFASMSTRGALARTPKKQTFEHFADRLIEIERIKGESGRISRLQSANSKSILRNAVTGPVKFFGRRDIREIQTKDYLAFMSWVRERNSSLSPATLNHIAVTFRKVMSVAQSEGVIDAVPSTPREKRKDNPRSFLRFHPLVTKDNDEYDKLLKAAKRLASEHVIVRGIPITEELYDFILFLTQSFLRPTISEVYSLTHRDVVVADNPKRLILTIRKGKTGHRSSITMPGAVSVYGRILKRQLEHTQDDFLFLPAYKNRDHAKRILQRQFNVVLERSGLKDDRYSDAVHTVYSLRHTAICMRLVLSEGKVNIFNLAKNAGTSVDQIERFYAKNLPLSAELARNLQSFGE